MAAVSTAAGRTTQRKLTGLVPGVSIINSIMKFLTLKMPGHRYGLWGSRFARSYGKILAAFWLYSFPGWFLMKYGSTDIMVAYFTNGDERWKSAPSQYLFAPESRALPAFGHAIMYNNPWRHYAKGYDSIPWGETTKFDDADESRGWAAFGTDYPGSQSRGKRAAWSGMQNMFSLYYDGKVGTEHESFTSFYCAMWGTAIRNWYRDVKYNWWDVWGEPVMEREESLGYRRHWLRARNNGGGFMNWKNIDYFEFFSPTNQIAFA